MLHIVPMKNQRLKDTDRGRRIRHIREEVLGLRSQEAFAKLLANHGKTVTRGAVGNWEVGGEIGIESIRTISEITRIPIDWIAYGRETHAQAGDSVNDKSPVNLSILNKPVDTVRLIGKVAANTWMDVDDMDFHYDDIQHVPTVGGYPAEWQFAVLVEGNCLNKVAAHGDILICLDIIRANIEFKDSDLVVVERKRFGGQMVERTAKRARQTAGGFELWPESHDPKHQEPIKLNDPRPDEEVTVIGKVLWVLKMP
jgi:hypothetical protein